MGFRHQIGYLGVMFIICFCIQSVYAQPQTVSRGEIFSAEISTVSAWCDHMPGIGGKRKRQHLVVTVEFENLTDHPITIQLQKAQLSFHENEEGELIEDSQVSLVGEDGRASGTKDVALAGKEKRQVKLRGDNLFREGQHGKQIYTTLTFSAEEEILAVRHSGVVMLTY